MDELLGLERPDTSKLWRWLAERHLGIGTSVTKVRYNFPSP